MPLPFKLAKEPTLEELEREIKVLEKEEKELHDIIDADPKAEGARSAVAITSTQLSIARKNHAKRSRSRSKHGAGRRKMKRTIRRTKMDGRRRR
jgi:hypothetical protein